MIGNDIIDLQLAKQSNRWKSWRFIEKLFTPEEQQFIQNSGSDRFELIWLLWSMKECAYKMHIQSGHPPSFAPCKIHCQLEEDKLSGSVTIDEQHYHTTSKITHDCIYTIAICSNKNSFFNHFEQLSVKSDLSLCEACYQAILLEYCNLMNINYNEVMIKKNDRKIPQIYRDHQVQDVELSITHHGQFYGYAMML